MKWRAKNSIPSPRKTGDHGKNQPLPLFPPHPLSLSLTIPSHAISSHWHNAEEEAEEAVAAHEVAAAAMAAIPEMMDIAKLNQTILCYAETIYRFNGLWEGPDPLTPLISLFLIQLTFSMGVIHLLVFALKPFNQPPFIAEVLVSLQFPHVCLWIFA